jgi:hypothetical protein
MLRSALATSFVAFGIVLAGCGGDEASDEPSGPDGAALAAAFGERADEAYADAGKDRDEDFGAGFLVKECFSVDDDAAAAIGEAAGFELTFGDSNFLRGVPDEEESLGCSVDADGDERPTIVMVTTGTTLAEPDQFLERLLRATEGVTEVEGDAPGLDPESVVATEADGISQFAWVDNDFFVGIGGPSEQLSTEEGFAALSATVDGVESTLSE